MTEPATRPDPRGLAHELANMIVAIRLNAGVARRRRASPEELEACLRDIEAAAEQASELLERLARTVRAGG